VIGSVCGTYSDAAHSFALIFESFAFDHGPGPWHMLSVDPQERTIKPMRHHPSSSSLRLPRTQVRRAVELYRDGVMCVAHDRSSLI
jgi:hypothetical protein